MFISDLATSGRLFPTSRAYLPIFAREEFSSSSAAISMMESKNFLLVPNALNLLRSLQHYNENREVVIFQQNNHRCNICFDSLPGTHFIRLTNCRHFLCKDCVKNLCVSMIKDGAVHKLQCMECSVELNPFDIELSVDSDTWDRYQKFQLDSALSTMQVRSLSLLS